MTFFFTADTHFDHDNIIKHCNRPFTYVNSMNSHLIEQWNNVVKRGDVIVIIGDFAWANKGSHSYVERMFINQLNGSKIFLKGNHDHWWKGEAKHIYRHTIEGQSLQMCHYPFRSWIRGYNLHGHSHGTLEPWLNQLDVGVDNAKKLVGEYRPLSMMEVDTLIKTQNGRIKYDNKDYHQKPAKPVVVLLPEHNDIRDGCDVPIREEQIYSNEEQHSMSGTMRPFFSTGEHF
jgi:calcineurin-like phosphoesterase family protein